MIPHYLSGKYVKLTIVAVILLVLNVLIVQYFKIDKSRILRVFSVLSLLLFFLYYKSYSEKLILVALTLFAFRDIMILDYEYSMFKTISFALTIAAYSSILLLTIKKLKISKSTPLIILLVIVLIALNVFNVYYLSDIIKAGLDTQLQFILFFIQGGMLILLGFAAFMYNERFQGKTPLIYLYMVLCFVLSDCFGLAAYFYEAQAAYFPERIFYLLGIVFLVNFALNTKKQKEEGKSLAEKEYIL
tara:strand:+ start:1547 stop:2281 length:735 start_codon:yes stop_codon:yes gene_type:complete